MIGADINVTDVALPDANSRVKTGLTGFGMALRALVYGGTYPRKIQEAQIVGGTSVSVKSLQILAGTYSMLCSNPVSRRFSNDETGLERKTSVFKWSYISALLHCVSGSTTMYEGTT